MTGGRDDADTEMHGRLLNWARCYEGGLPSIETIIERPSKGMSNENDAVVIETALNIIRYRRPRIYKLARRVYLHKATTKDLCRDFRCSEGIIKVMRRSLYVGLDLMLAAYESRAKPMNCSAIEVMQRDLRARAKLTKGTGAV